MLILARLIIRAVLGAFMQQQRLPRYNLERLVAS